MNMNLFQYNKGLKYVGLIKKYNIIHKNIYNT